MAGNSTGYPLIFKFDENEYMIGSEVGVYMNLHRGALYKKFPSLWRRIATPEERKQIINITNGNTYAMVSSVTLLKANEVLEIIKGMGERFKKKSIHQYVKETSMIVDQEEEIDESVHQTHIPTNITTIEPNFKPTLPAKYPIESKRIRTFPLFYFPVGKIYNNEKDDELIPIVLDISKNQMKLRDYFLWNSNDPSITTTMLAELLCDDFGLPADVFVDPIMSSMKQQIEDYHYMTKESVTPNSAIERRVIIRLDLRVGNIRLQDKFEWDIYDKINSPELFAQSIVKELGLCSEFIPRISIEIRCQVNWYRSLYISQSRHYLPALVPPIIRNHEDLNSWCPKITLIHEDPKS